jgi:hypothetical protein
MDGPLCVLADPPRQYQALLEVSQSVASHCGLTALFQDLVERLPRVVCCPTRARAPLPLPDCHCNCASLKRRGGTSTREDIRARLLAE